MGRKKCIRNLSTRQNEWCENPADLSSQNEPKIPIV
jgi:hypothetical protein